LVPEEAIQQRQEERIHELARRFVSFVTKARAHLAKVKGALKSR
jgi:hypothetical protein